MFAVIREVHFVPEKLAAGAAQVAEFTMFLERQPGFHGQIVVDTGSGRSVATELWADETHYRAAFDTVNAAAARLMAPMFAVDRQPPLIGTGTVIFTSAGIVIGS